MIHIENKSKKSNKNWDTRFPIEMIMFSTNNDESLKQCHNSFGRSPKFD